MDRILCFKPHLRVEILDGERLFLIGERERFMLSSRLYALIAAQLDGRRSVRQLIAALAGQASALEILYAVGLLEDHGYIIEAAPALPPATAAFWQGLGVNPGQAAQRLAAMPVAVHALSGLDPAPLREALASAGVHVTEHAALRVWIVEDYLEPALEGLNREALVRGESWLLLKPGGTTPWMGPIFRPHAGPCWECLSQRLRENRPVESFLLRRAGTTGPLSPPSAWVAASQHASLHLAALGLARWITEERQGALGTHLLTLDLAQLRFESHAVVRRPQCPACGDPTLLSSRARQPLRLEPRPKRFTEDGGFRSVTPEQTFARYQHLISPLTGFISSLGPVAERDHPLRCVQAAVYFTPPRSGSLDSDDFHEMSAGKGRTPAQARASALCEAIERRSAIFQGDEPRQQARLADLGDEAIHPHALLGFSADQYARRDELNAAHGDRKRAIPLPFDPEWEIEWTPLWSLTRERHRYLPTAWCYGRYPLPPERLFCRQDSNGHAAGNCLEEAILQGFLELVERDAVALWWYNRRQPPGVELESFGDPWVQQVLEHYHALRWDVWALDLTHDLGIPVMTALGRSRETGRFCVGFGCHLDARLAAQRALTELSQLFDPASQRPPPWEASAVEGQSFLFAHQATPPRRASDFPRLWHDELREDIRECVARAARLGLEILVLDQTRPDVGLCAVKVAVPGLRHFWPRFGPGRLYEVPVQLGWRERPLLESELNPVHLFL